MTVHNQQLYENSCLYVSVNAAVCLCEDLVLISFSFFPDVCVCVRVCYLCQCAGAAGCRLTVATVSWSIQTENSTVLENVRSCAGGRVLIQV